MKYFVSVMAMVAGTAMAETLYNGIEIPEQWPPAIDRTNNGPMRVPYLEAGNIPKTIPIDVGRQLFVDDFLVESMDGLERIYGKPKKYEGNPVLRPETPWEVNTPGNATTRPNGGGMWWDAKARRFHLWYESGWCREICYAWSKDGIRWERPSLDIVPGSNRLLPDQHVDSWSVWPEPEDKGPDRKWNLFINPGGNPSNGDAYTSADGIHWTNHVKTGLNDDRSTLFYNPFRRKWVWSLRAGWRARSRAYREHDDFLAGSEWRWPQPARKDRVPGVRYPFTNTADCVAWLAADDRDVQTDRPAENRQASLYNFDAVGYESIMLGAFEAHWGPENDKCMLVGMPKITDLQFAYSRDGFHFSRPDRTAAIASERWDSGKWDAGYVQSLSNLLVIRGDELWFYYGAFAGDRTRLTPDDPAHIPNSGNGSLNGIYANGAMGLARLRRDGFVGLKANAKGTVTTQPVRFGGRKLFVNLDAPKGGLVAEVLDRDGRTLATLPRVSGDRTKLAVGDVAAFAGRDVRFRFTVEGGTLYSFWVSKDASGKSGGYLAGGGPGYAGYRDL